MSAVLVEPAVKLLERRGAIVRLSHRLRNLGKSGGHISELDFGDDKIAITLDDAVILAVPPRTAATLLPGLKHGRDLSVDGQYSDDV